VSKRAIKQIKKLLPTVNQFDGINFLLVYAIANMSHIPSIVAMQHLTPRWYFWHFATLAQWVRSLE